MLISITSQLQRKRLTKNQIHPLKYFNQLAQLVQRFGTDADDPRVFQVKEVNTDKTPITSLLWDRRKQLSQSENVNNAERWIQHSETSTIKEKISTDSSLTIPYDFRNDSVLRDSYADARGSILLGKIFEDLDAFAGNIAYLHVVGDLRTDEYKGNIPSLVTASVDKITLASKQRKISITNDNLVLCGQVAWVGKSSLDIVMEIHHQESVKKYSSEGKPMIYDPIGSPSRLLSSYFTFVARDRRTGKAINVNKLKPCSESELKLYHEREELASLRRMKVETTETNKDILRSLVERGCSVEDMPAIAHPNAVLMNRTSLENTFLCEPQNGNTAGRVFGGFLLHRAYDLALATCYTFAGSYPQFKQVDKVVFKRPVDIGDLVRMKSRIVYTTDNPIDPIAVVEVTCQIVRPEKAASFVSNTFNFEFCFDDNVNLRRILPVNYEEAEIIINASRSVGTEE